MCVRVAPAVVHAVSNTPEYLQHALEYGAKSMEETQYDSCLHVLLKARGIQEDQEEHRIAHAEGAL